MPSVRMPHLAIAASRLWALAATLAGCHGDRRSGATSADGSVDSESAVEIRVAGGDVERGVLLGSDRVFVQAERGSMFLYHRAGGRRTPVAAPPGPGGKSPQVVWAQGLGDGTVAAYDFRAAGSWCSTRRARSSERRRCTRPSPRRAPSPRSATAGWSFSVTSCRRRTRSRRARTPTRAC